MGKTCKKCHEEKSASDFYAHPKTADRLFPVCKACVARRTVEYRAQHREQYREYAKAQKLKNRKPFSIREGAEKLKHSVREYTRMAIKSGKVSKPKNCQICGVGCSRIQAHHNDYSNKLDVLFVCASCHKLIHTRGTAYGKTA